MTSAVILSINQQSALAKLLALRKVTAETGTRTTYSQNVVLQKLSPDDLTAVSVALAQHQETFGW